MNNEATRITQSKVICAFLPLSSLQQQFFFDGKQDFAHLNSTLHFLSHSNYLKEQIIPQIRPKCVDILPLPPVTSFLV